MSGGTLVQLILLTVVFVAAVTWMLEKRRRRTHGVPAGFQADLELPHQARFELYHNALSLCSMKTRLCLAELQIPYVSHPVDLIETGCYENIRPAFLRVNPGGTVPVLLHQGHPIYESHEQIRYAARHAPDGVASLVPEDPARAEEMEAWIDRSSLTEDPLNHGDKSAGNAVPGLTVPLFCTMIEKIPYIRIFEGFLFHFDRFRPFLFTVLKLRGIERLHRIRPAANAIGRSLGQMAVHLDALEAQLTRSGGPWILGDFYSLADVSWLVIFERLRQADSLDVFVRGGQRPACAAYWNRLTQRPAYREAILEQGHPIIEHGTARLIDAKANDSELRAALEGG